MLQDTICAIATAPGEAGISVIRISGAAAKSTLKKIFTPKGAVGEFEPRPRYMHFGVVRDESGALIDEALAVYMPAPHSYTGEDVAEIHSHGGYVVSKAILEVVLATGVMLAEPGEFTQRAFINGKLNLTQAEAVIDIIQAKSTEALKISERQLDGSLGRRVLAENDKLLDILAQIEVAVDYPEEEGDIWAELGLAERLRATVAVLDELLASAREGKLYRDGALVTIAGPANAGKSTLLNHLLEEERAIVTEIPGTTRDTIEEYYTIKGLPLRLVDTAGIRETADRIEAAGIAKSREKLAAADLVILMWDINRAADEFRTEWLPLLAELGAKPLILLLNKADLYAGDATAVAAEFRELLAGGDVLTLSVKQAAALETLKELIFARIIGDRVATEHLSGLINDRQKSALGRAREHLLEAIAAYEAGIDGDMVAIDIQAAWQALAEITGSVTSDDIISRVFSRFCLGK